LSYLTVECDTTLARGLAACGRGSGIAGEGLAVGSAGAACYGARDKNAPLGHTRDFDLKPATPFRRAVTALKPDATGSDLVRLLEGKARRTTALGWFVGRRQAPKWTLDILARKIREQALPAIALANELDKEKERLGLSAGALNLRKYHANKNR
jgi:hypothetical protein